MIDISKWWIYIVLPLFFSCTPSVVPIQYGSDSCAFCKMSIVDRKFGAELVTKKTKAFKFDAVECLIDYYSEMEPDLVALLLVNTFDQPAQLFLTDSCVFLVSKELPSPMGAFINPFKSIENALKMLQMHGGEIYQWKEIQEYQIDN